MQTQTIIEKINGLPPEKLVEVEDFIDFLKEKSNREIKESRFQIISEYAAKHAESDADFDEELHEASLEFLSEAENQ